MKEPLPAKGKVAPAPRDAVVKPARSTVATEVRVVAHFYRRMKPQRVYPLVVELQAPAGGDGGLTAPVFVHPFIPGAHVTPTEQALDPAVPGGKATFYVTPLARGTLHNARLDIFYQGRLIQEVPLPLRAVTQRFTWALAALTVLIPLFLLYYTVYHPLQGYKFVERPIPPAGANGEEEAPKGKPEKTLKNKKNGAAEKEKDAGAPEKLEKAPKKEDGPDKGNDEGDAEPGDTLAADAGPDQDGAPQEKPERKKSGRGDGPPIIVEPTTRTIQYPAEPGEVLEERILKNVPDLPAKVELPWSSSDNPSEITIPFAITKHVAWGLGTVYDYLCSMKTDYVCFWIGVVLLGMTIASAVVHRPARARRRSKPLLLTAAGLQPPHA